MPWKNQEEAKEYRRNYYKKYFANNPKAKEKNNKLRMLNYRRTKLIRLTGCSRISILKLTVEELDVKIKENTKRIKEIDDNGS